MLRDDIRHRVQLNYGSFVDVMNQSKWINTQRKREEGDN